MRGTYLLIGYESADTTGRKLLALAGDDSTIERPGVESSGIRLPFLGEIDPAHYSLLALTVLMGLSDGFNPCAMWVLVYLISLIAGMQDRRKIWWFVGTFVLTSSILYFLVMTAWLNTFLVLGYTRPLTQLIALVAIGFGANHLYELAVSHGAIVCEVGNPNSASGRCSGFARGGRAGRARKPRPGGRACLCGQCNRVRLLGGAARHLYPHAGADRPVDERLLRRFITLYVIFFMLDDLVIFGFAAFAFQKMLDTRYAAFSRGAGGMILIGLGIWMLTLQ